MRPDGSLSSLYSSGLDPVVSVYVDLSIGPAETQWGLPLRWRTLREALQAEGAVDEMLRPVDERVQRAEPSDRTLAAFSRAGRLELDEELVDGEVPDVAAVGPLPLALPLLRWRNSWVPYLVVLVDRAGADLAAYAGPGEPVSEEEVIGPDDEIERNAPGGTAQMRYQRRAEDSWAHNADEVSQRVTKLVESTGARLVLTAGDVRALQELTDHLPERVRPLQRTVTSGLTQTTPGRARIQPRVVRELVRGAAAQERAQVLAELADASGGGPAVTGVADTTEKLRQGAVRHLLVVDRAGDDRQAEIGQDPRLLTPADGSRSGGADGPLAPLGEAWVRAALAQSAEVTVLAPDEAELPEDVGALLRY